jgi:protein-glutamine gamma-glutamyltransferase
MNYWGADWQENWTGPKLSQHGIRVKTGSSPAHALRQLWNALKTGGASGDCASGAALPWLKALLDTYGDEQFDKYFEKGAIDPLIVNGFDGTLPPHLDRDSQPIDLPGDLVFFSNPGGEDPWGGENAIQLGDNEFYAHPFGIRSGDEIIAALNKQSNAHNQASLDSIRSVPLWNAMGVWGKPLK